MAWLIPWTHRDMSQVLKEMDFFHFFQSMGGDAVSFISFTAHFFHFFEGVGAP